MACRSIGLLLEGDGVYEAVLLLLRSIAGFRQYFDLVNGSRPIIVGDYVCMLKGERFLRLFEYALFRDDLDGIVIALDCDDGCALDVVAGAYDRIRDLADRANKPV